MFNRGAIVTYLNLDNSFSINLNRYLLGMQFAVSAVVIVIKCVCRFELLEVFQYRETNKGGDKSWRGKARWRYLRPTSARRRSPIKMRGWKKYHCFRISRE